MKKSIMPLSPGDIPVAIACHIGDDTGGINDSCSAITPVDINLLNMDKFPRNITFLSKG